jgi:hypothetical protein
VPLAIRIAWNLPPGPTWLGGGNPSISARNAADARFVARPHDQVIEIYRHETG